MSGGTANTIRNCFISLNTGIGIFYTGFQGVIENCNIGGGYAKGDDLNKSIGIFTRGSNIRNGMYANLSTAICLIAGPSIVEFLDIERCGVGIRVGYNPITYWESNTNNLWVPQNNPTGPIGSVIRMITMESIADTFVWLQNFSGKIEQLACASYGQITNPRYGIRCELAVATDFWNVSASGAYSIAAIDAFNSAGCIWRNCSVPSLATSACLDSTDRRPNSLPHAICWLRFRQSLF